MSDKSDIEWTDATWNPVRGCIKVSPGCKNCYAETFAERFRGVPGHPYEQGFDPRLVPEKLGEPLKWQKGRRIFVNSMSDLFGDFVPDEYIASVFAVMASSGHHTFQILTKRAERLPRWFAWLDANSANAVERYVMVDRIESDFARGALTPPCEDPDPPTPHLRHLYDVGASLVNEHMPGGRLHMNQRLGECHWRSWPLSNVHLGVSVEDRKFGVPRIEHLRQTPAAVRFLSIEPLLEDVGELDLTGIHQVIVGAENGHGARPMREEWVRSIRDQAKPAGCAFFYKQATHPTAKGRVVSLPILDGRQWAEMPR